MENAVEIVNLGKMYRLFDKQSDRIQDIFGLDKLRFWDREPRYREFWALRNINLTVPKGERIGIIGRNGAGKSTLLKLIVGNLRPTEGSIHVNGKIQALLQIGTGFHPEFTGIENIRTALAYAGMDSKKIKSCMDEIIEFSELEDYIHQPVKYYSAGMYSRLAFAVSTSLEPDILIIDEVLGAGDAAFTSKCAERMKHLTQDTGATVLFVSHSMESVLEICNRAILLERGEITHQGTALEVSKIYNKKIRYEEELRARAKEFRISRKSMLNIAQADEATQVLVMRLVCDTPHPHYKHLIYGCELSADGEPVSQLHFGAPMDDDPAQFTRVIADKGGMDWSDAKKDRGNFYRAYCDQDGSNCHAPFQMEIPLHLSGKALSVCIHARPDSREKIYLEYFDGHAYRRLGQVENGNTSFSFRLAAEEDQPIESASAPAAEAEQPQALETEPISAPDARSAEPVQEKEEPLARDRDATDFQQMQQTNSVYGSQELRIEAQDILDGTGKSVRCFTTGDTLRFQIQLAAHKAVRHFVAVVCIMTRSGKTVTQLFCTSEDLGISSIPENGHVTIGAELSPLRIGEGEYMVSIGIFKQCTMSKAAEEPSYCVSDRALFFKVEQPFGVKKGLGDLLHPCDWSCGAVHHVFDGTALKSEEVP